MYMYLPNREKTENYFFEEKKKIVRLSRFSAFFTREGPYFSSFQQFHFRYNLTIVSWISEKGSYVGDILNFMDLMYTL